MFIHTLTEKVSAMINGICLVSLYSKSQLSLEDMKAIMGGVMDIISGEKADGEEGGEKERE